MPVYPPDSILEFLYENFPESQPISLLRTHANIACDEKDPKFSKFFEMILKIIDEGLVILSEADRKDLDSKMYMGKPTLYYNIENIRLSLSKLGFEFFNQLRISRSVDNLNSTLISFKQESAKSSKDLNYLTNILITVTTVLLIATLLSLVLSSGYKALVPYANYIALGLLIITITYIVIISAILIMSYYKNKQYTTN